VKLRYTPRALAELDEVLTYIAERSPQGARNVRTRIDAIITMLLQHPGVGQLTSKGRLRRIGASPYPYLIFYRETGTEIVIHGVRHSARNPSSMPDHLCYARVSTDGQSVDALVKQLRQAGAAKAFRETGKRRARRPAAAS
jgi:toxin ParE1/3/4